MVTITVFCGSKLTINNGLKEGIEGFIKGLGKDFKFAYGGGSDGIMGIVNSTCIDNGYYTIGVNCHRWKDEGDEKLNEVYYFDRFGKFHTVKTVFKTKKGIKKPKAWRFYKRPQ